MDALNDYYDEMPMEGDCPENLSIGLETLIKILDEDPASPIQDLLVSTVYGLMLLYSLLFIWRIYRFMCFPFLVVILVNLMEVCFSVVSLSLSVI